MNPFLINTVARKAARSKGANRQLLPVNCFFLPVIAILLASCSALKSYTTVMPNDRFVLGNNQHGPFHATLTYVSQTEVTVYQTSPEGREYSPRRVAPGRQVRVRVEKNTALVVANNSPDTSIVKLRVKGDTGLSMRYGQ